MRLAFLLIAAMTLGPTLSQGQTDPALYGALKWRNLGPERGGRSLACSGVPGSPDEFYMGTCGGGLWKTTNAGEDWTPISDGWLGTGTVGAIAVAPSQPRTVYIGTGERDLRGNVSHGDGVYRTDDGGKTWKHIGLRESQNVSRIAVHPHDPDTVWVAVLGHVYGPNPERGVFKTTDGGKTWKRTLFVGDRAGAVHIALDPNDPTVLYAATWDGWRTPWSLNSGGPNSKLWKSTDGGETWSDLSRNPGMPTGTLGKIGVSPSPAKKGRVYAIVEAAEGGVFVSDDAGATWTKVDSANDRRQRAFYYTHIYAHPKDADTVYVLNVAAYKSTNGGKSFTPFMAGHSDNHDIWVDPSDPQRLAVSNDGGTSVSINGGRNWSDQDYATGQIYHVSTDTAIPYRILGAQQDNSTIRIASRNRSARIGEEDWTSTAGGESGYVVAKPDNPDIVLGGNYGGDLSLLDHGKGVSRSIDPWPDNPMGSGAGENKERFQWTFPIVFSPHDPNIVYSCSQHVWRSKNLGASWERISPDLTRADPSTLLSSGGPITKDNTSVEYYATVFTLAESRLQPGLLWAGSDDGRVHVTRDGGKRWEEVTPAGFGEWSLVSMVEPSPHAAGTCYLAVDRHEVDDFAPYVYKTTDFGKTWRRLDAGLPSEAFVRVVREDPQAPGVLYCGTEVGVFVSLDAGHTWQKLNNGMPVVPVHDLVVKDNDLVAATHGRSFFVLDRLSPLRQAAGVAKSGKAHLYRPEPGSTLTWGPVSPGIGANPPSGIVLDYVLFEKAEKAEIVVTDGAGTVVGRSRAETVPGQARATVRLSYPGYRGFPGMVFWAAGSRPIKAPPGTYQATLTVDGEEHTVPLDLQGDPRYGSSVADLRAQFQLSMEIVAQVNLANGMVVKLKDLSAMLKAQREAAPAATATIDTYMLEVAKASDVIYQSKSVSSQDPLNYPIRLNNKLAALLGVVQSGEWAPTRQSYEVFEDLSAQLKAALATCEILLGAKLDEVNKAIVAAGGKAVSVPVGG
ncbi:MAG: glycosyl hydrolase [Fimbriimonadaceae bacterium]|nr:glycosyl hydrolase [Fimbriimonadaceae bacterium]